MKQEQKTVLSIEDQKNVDVFLRSGFNQIPRNTFRPFLLSTILAITIVLLGLLARLIGALYLPF